MNVRRRPMNVWTEWMWATSYECAGLSTWLSAACTLSIPFRTFYLPLLVTERQANHTCCLASAPYRCPWLTCAWSPLQVFCQGQWNFSKSDLRCEVPKEMLFRKFARQALLPHNTGSTRGDCGFRFALPKGRTKWGIIVLTWVAPVVKYRKG